MFDSQMFECSVEVVWGRGLLPFRVWLLSLMNFIFFFFESFTREGCLCCVNWA